MRGAGNPDPVRRARTRLAGGLPAARFHWLRRRLGPVAGARYGGEGGPFSTIFDPASSASARERAIEAAIRGHLGIAVDAGMRRAARALCAGRAIERPEGRALAAISAFFLLDRASAGHRCHVLDMGRGAEALARQLAPLLDAARLDWACQSVGQTPGERSRGYRADILFALPQQVALDILLARRSGQVGQGGRRRHLTRLSASLDHGPQPDHFDTALILDAEDALCHQSLTAIVASDRDGDEAPSLTAEEAMGVAAQLTAEDFSLTGANAMLTPRGRQRLATMAGMLGPDWGNAARGELAVRRALMALHLWREGEHYLIGEDDLIALAPEVGAPAAEGLAPLDFLRLKERLDQKVLRKSVERMALRSLFMRYRHRAAVAGGLAIHAGELRRAYGMAARRSPAPRPELLCLHPDDLGGLLKRRRCGPFLMIVLKGDADRARALAAALREGGTSLFDPDALPEECLAPARARVMDGILWLERPLPEDLAALLASVSPLCTPVVIGSYPGDWCHIGRGGGALAVGLLPPAATVGGPGGAWRWLSHRAAAGDSVALKLTRAYAARRYRRVARSEAWLRGQMYHFDARCRRAVSFLTEIWE